MIKREVFKQICLPQEEAFYSNLKFKGISDEDYRCAQEMWKRYGCETMQDFHNIYLKLDVTLLADVVMNIRTIAIDQYKLDPFHSWTLAGFTWQCCLKMTKVEL